MVSQKEPCEGGGTSRQREQETQGANGVKEEALFQKPKGQHLQREKTRKKESETSQGWWSTGWGWGQNHRAL